MVEKARGPVNERMEAEEMTLLALFPLLLVAIILALIVAVVAHVVVTEYRKHQRWKAEHRQRVAQMHFWNAQVMKSIDDATKAMANEDWEAFDRAHAAYRTNLHRYEKDVLGL